jgi:hypothetical protein
MTQIQKEYLLIAALWVAAGFAVAKIQNLWASAICLCLAAVWVLLCKAKKFDNHSLIIGGGGLLIAAIGKAIALNV